MTSQEIVRRTLDFENPERVARSFDESDFRSAGNTVTTPATGWEEVGPDKWERTDEWGNLWGRIDPTSKGEVIKGVLEAVDDLGTYELPDYSSPDDYAIARERREEFSGMWLNGGIPGFAFNIARKMFKLEEYLVELMVNRDQIHELHDRIDRMIVDMIRNYAAAGVDGITFGEDWGTQTQTLISPALWHEEFYPRFERLCGIAHDCGVKVLMHSCGHVEEIVPGLIKAGIDLLQFDQPDLHGIDNLAAYQEDAKISFWCPVDIQVTLQQKDETVIREKVREMLDKLWSGRGGFVAGYYGDNPSIGLDPKWQAIASEEFISYGVPKNGSSG